MAVTVLRQKGKYCQMAYGHKLEETGFFQMFNIINEYYYQLAFMFTQNNGIIEHSLKKQILSVSFHLADRKNSWETHSSPKGLPQSSDYSTIESDATSKHSSQQQSQCEAHICFQSELKKCSLFDEGYCSRGQNCEYLHEPISQDDKSKRQERRLKFVIQNYPQILLSSGNRHKSFLQ